MTRRAPLPLRRDIVFLVLGGAWGTFTVVTAGPWPLMLISVATMLGPGFIRLWLSEPGTGLKPGSRPEESREPLSSPSLGRSDQGSGADSSPPPACTMRP